MISSKADFIRTFMPESVVSVECAQINLDITDLTLGDILRNLNKTYTPNSRARNAIISGSMVAAVLCKTETLDPLTGLFIILSNDSLEFQMVSRNYIVVCISENNITDDEKIVGTIERITKYIAKNFKSSLADLHGFYSRFIYDPTELEMEDETVYLPKANEEIEEL